MIQTVVRLPPTKLKRRHHQRRKRYEKMMMAPNGKKRKMKKRKNQLPTTVLNQQIVGLFVLFFSSLFFLVLLPLSFDVRWFHSVFPLDTIISFLPKNLLEQFRRIANFYFLIMTIVAIFIGEYEFIDLLFLIA